MKIPGHLEKRCSINIERDGIVQYVDDPCVHLVEIEPKVFTRYDGIIVTTRQWRGDIIAVDYEAGSSITTLCLWCVKKALDELERREGP